MRIGPVTILGLLAMLSSGAFGTPGQPCRGGPLWPPLSANRVSALDNPHATPSASLRVAVVGFVGDSGSAVTAVLRKALSTDERVSTIEPEQIRPAADGVGYSGSINMTLEEARRLGSAIGCDFFIVGKAEALTRSEQKMETHGEAIIGVMLVDGRSGRLVLFQFIREKAPAAVAALERGTTALMGCAQDFVDKMQQYQKARISGPAPTGPEKGRSADLIEDIPEESSAKSAGFVPPQFLNRAKPDYTAEADLAGIAATVEALAVFKANGEVGEIEITRWAGYGLDESAERAIRVLKFKPATRGGRVISVRALIRYNFKVRN
jgi:TonB family protein